MKVAPRENVLGMQYIEQLVPTDLSDSFIDLEHDILVIELVAARE